MKILHVITLAELGGAQSVVLNLATESILHGDDIMVASSESGELWNALPAMVKQFRISPLKRSINILNELRVLKALRKVNADFQPDVIHLHSSKIGILGRLVFPTQKIIYTVHGFDSIRIGFPQFLKLERALQKRARFVVGVSKYDLINLARERIYGNLECIYNGIKDCHQFGDETEKPVLIQPNDPVFTRKVFKVMCIARISPQKKFDLFCEVAEKLSNHSIQFYWIGNKEPVINLPANVHCLGQIEYAHQLLKDADLFILPTNYEGMPISIIEALCYGVPVVASDVGGVSEMLDGTNGIAVENDAGAFVSAILKFSQNEDFLTKSSLAARKSYETNFTVQKMFAAYMELYSAISSGTGEILRQEKDMHNFSFIPGLKAGAIEH